MELKAGYKQTEAGVIPWDWDAKPLQAVCAEKITYGIVQCGPHIENGVPYIRVSDMNSPELDVSSMLRTSPAIASSFSRSRVNEGDIVYALRGKLGEVRRVNYAVAGANLTQGTARIAPNKQVDGSYLLWSLRSQSALRQVELEAKGSTFREITLANLRAIEIAVPPILEQQAIAEALSDTDALIESLDQLIAKKRQIKQGAMQELLTGKRRLPGFSGTWNEVTIKKAVQIPVTDGPHITPVFLDDGVPFLSVNNLIDGKIDFSDLRYISVLDHEEFSKKCKPQKEDILLGKAASVGKVALVETNTEFNIWSPLALIRVNSKNHAKFVYYQLQSTNLNRQISLLTNSSSQGNIGMGDIEKLVLPLPDKDEQLAIATILSDMDTELSALESRLAKARQIKQGMMQELLTGRIRLL